MPSRPSACGSSPSTCCRLRVKTCAPARGRSGTRGCARRFRFATLSAWSLRSRQRLRRTRPSSPWGSRARFSNAWDRRTTPDDTAHGSNGRHGSPLGLSCFGPPGPRRALARSLRARWPARTRRRWPTYRRVDRAARRTGLLARRRRRHAARGPRRARTVTDGLHAAVHAPAKNLIGDSMIRKVSSRPPPIRRIHRSPWPERTWLPALEECRGPP